MNNRVIAFKALVGSHNYNLATAFSDKDYKAFVYPTFDDLYKGEFVKKSQVTNVIDIEYHDVRKLPMLFSKSNVNFLEILFTEEITSNDGLHRDLWNLRFDIARMNLPYLYDACMGMYNKEVAQFRRKIAAGDTLRASKFAASAVRITDFLVRFYQTDFEDMKKAMWYDEDDMGRSYVLFIKNGEMDVEHIEPVLKAQELAAVGLKQKYKIHNKNTELEQHLNHIVKDYVKVNLNI